MNAEHLDYLENVLKKMIELKAYVKEQKQLMIKRDNSEAVVRLSYIEYMFLQDIK